MKRILISLILAAAVFPAAAQDFKGVFDEFAKESGQSYTEFKKESDKSFADLMIESWQEFKVLDALQRPEKPKPETLPVAPKDTVPASVALPQPVPSQPMSEPVVQTPPTPRPAPEEPSENKPVAVVPEGELYRYDFYNSKVEVRVPKSMTDFHMRNASKEEVRAYWKYLEKTSFTSLLSQIDAYVERFALSGWSRYLLVDALVDAIFKITEGHEREVFKTYLLNSMKINAKLANADGRLTTLVSVDEQVYARVFVEIGGLKFYLDPECGEVENLYSYDVDMSDDLRPMSVMIDRPLNLNGGDLNDKGIVLVGHPSKVFGAEFNILVNLNICKYYLDFPQVDVDVYAKSAVDAEFSKALLDSFRPYLSGKTALEQVSALLSFMHHDFQYATDNEQFGFEKPFFLEEDFIYPCNDCEDRSILFSYLVRNLVGLDVVLLDYPDHIATAVAFSGNVKGDYFTYGGKRYTVCDPTYIGAPVGMTMEGYSDKEFKILEL